MARLPSGRRPPRGIRVEIVWRRGCRPPVPDRMVRAARWVLRSLGRKGEVALLFTGDGEIRALNRRYRGLDRPTDILSFPGSPSLPEEGYLGDIAISVETARKYAKKAGWRLDEELQFLILHGLLHLLGHDHETDSGAMDKIQADLCGKLLGREVPPARVGRAGKRVPGPSSLLEPRNKTP